jgi:hypothetical protein
MFEISPPTTSAVVCLSRLQAVTKPAAISAHGSRATTLKIFSFVGDVGHRAPGGAVHAIEINCLIAGGSGVSVAQQHYDDWCFQWTQSS